MIAHACEIKTSGFSNCRLHFFILLYLSVCTVASNLVCCLYKQAHSKVFKNVHVTNSKSTIALQILSKSGDAMLLIMIGASC